MLGLGLDGHACEGDLTCIIDEEDRNVECFPDGDDERIAGEDAIPDPEERIARITVVCEGEGRLS